MNTKFKTEYKIYFKNITRKMHWSISPVFIRNIFSEDYHDAKILYITLL